MTQTISDKIGAYLGWCPNARTLDAQTHSTKRIEPSGITEPEPPQPGTFPTTLAEPHWMTAAALAILFATFFVGGNLWWVAFVLAVLVIFVIIRVRTLQIQRR
ncbi:MAG: hypothetical protein PHT99_07100 [Methanoregula sp.]|nr:hypothetical protein [Methanoregula sp.]